jgi:hypothetical protein
MSILRQFTTVLKNLCLVNVTYHLLSLSHINCTYGIKQFIKLNAKYTSN